MYSRRYPSIGYDNISKLRLGVFFVKEINITDFSIDPVFSAHDKNYAYLNSLA